MKEDGANEKEDVAQNYGDNIYIIYICVCFNRNELGTAARWRSKIVFSSVDILHNDLK